MFLSRFCLNKEGGRILNPQKCECKHIALKNNHLSAWRDFKTNFSRPLFTIIFRPKIVSLDTNSILRVKTMYESVKKDALRTCRKSQKTSVFNLKTSWSLAIVQIDYFNLITFLCFFCQISSHCCLIATYKAAQKKVQTMQISRNAIFR